jgi:hypothetical protein
MSKGDWSDDENDATVAAYFDMLATEISSQSYNKSERRRELACLIGRSEGAIEFKNRNVSAVLKGMGEVWIKGYLPAFNFQWPLVDAVARWLAHNPAWNIQFPVASNEATKSLREVSPLWIGPPPTQRNVEPPAEVELMLRVASHFDAAGRDARNRVLGLAGEERVLEHERASLTALGRADLAERVKWVSQENGDGAGFDILSFEEDGNERLLEVKTTNGWERTPFHISRNELKVAEVKRETWHLIRLWDFSREPRAFSLRPPLSSHVELTPTSFMASFDSRN